MAEIYRSGSIPRPDKVGISWLENRFFDTPIDNDPDLKSLSPPQWRGKAHRARPTPTFIALRWAFWARREADGTRLPFYQFLTKMLQTYDSDFQRRRALLKKAFP